MVAVLQAVPLAGWIKGSKGDYVRKLGRWLDMFLAIVIGICMEPVSAIQDFHNAILFSARFH